MNEEKFRIYLGDVTSQKDTKFDERTINDMVDVLKVRIPNQISNIGNLLDIEDIEYLNIVKKRLGVNGDLYEYNRSDKTGRPSQALYRYISFLEKRGLENLKSQKKTKSFKRIKNIILYGSPGVGKTHNTNKLIHLIEDGESDSEIFKTIEKNKRENSIDISDIKERVKFITFHQSFGYEDFIEGFRPTEEGTIQRRKGVFLDICEDAQKNLDDSKIEITNPKVNLDELIVKFTNYIQDSLDEEREFFLTDKITIESINNTGSFLLGGSIKSNTQRLTIDILKRDYEIFKEGQISSYEDIKPTYDSQRTFHGNARYYYFLYKKLYEFEQTLNSTDIERVKVELKNYYLVIDEINRGNISKIFGELITLIEEDKRDKLEVTLPYSKQSFKIPSNLYIIGTMNSTDKSIALIDIALRRRFTFLKMKPNVELVPTESQELFKKLNEYIAKTLGEDYQIGHSYFMGAHDLDFILEYKIKPLVEEYFYGDDKGLKEVLELIDNN